MSRGFTIQATITPQQMRLIRQRVRAGLSRSASDAVRQGLEMLLDRKPASAQRAKTGSAKPQKSQLAAAYRAMAAHDRKLAREWAQLDDAWPE